MENRSDKKKIIVSLTSFPGAISYAGEAVKSILNGSVLPDKIVLYITLSRFGDSGVPQELQNLSNENPIFEIRDFNPDIRSYQKLIPALSDFPDDVIVTIDDDIYYHKNMLRDLIRLHKRLPNAIIAHRVRHINLDMPYRKWHKYKWYHFLLKRIHLGFSNLQTGVGGVLYPPHSLKKEMLNIELFTKIAPTMDDIWFWAAAVAKGTYVVPVPFGYRKPRELGKPNSLSLRTINFRSGTDRNAATLKAILEKYPLIKQRIFNEK